MIELPESLQRSVLIHAPREAVFRYFADSKRFAAWWGIGSSIDPRPGGAVKIRYPNNVVAVGEVVAIDPPRSVIFTYGYEEPSRGISPGGSRVTVTLEANAEGTVVHLRHEFADARIRDQHVQGWRYQLALFSRTVSSELQSDAAERVDAYLRAWGEPDTAERRRLLEASAAKEIVLRDSYGATSGLEDLLEHLAAVQIYMPGMTLERSGQVRECQGTAVAGWVAKGKNGERRASGTNVYDFAPDGRISRVVGLWES